MVKFLGICKTMVVTAVLALGLVAVMPQASAAEDIVSLYQGWDSDLQAYTAKVCKEYDVDETLVLAVIYNESRFQSGLTHKNTNGTTDYGPMQVNEVNFDFLHKELGISSMRELLDDETGIECGVYLLSYHKAETENDAQALLRYQVGAGNYDKMKAGGRTTNKTHTQVLAYQKTIAGYFDSIKKPDTKYKSPYKTLRAEALFFCAQI